ncbi:MAG: hypothetical protein ACM3UN_05145, partial [Bacillota bacterium]
KVISREDAFGMIDACLELTLEALIPFEKPSKIVKLEVPEFRTVSFIVSPMGTFSTNRMFVISARSELAIKPTFIPPAQVEITKIPAKRTQNPTNKKRTHILHFKGQSTAIQWTGLLIRLMNPKSTVKLMKEEEKKFFQSSSSFYD